MYFKDPQTSSFEYIGKICWGIRLRGPQDDLFRETHPINFVF